MTWRLGRCGFPSIAPSASAMNGTPTLWWVGQRRIIFGIAGIGVGGIQRVMRSLLVLIVLGWSVLAYAAGGVDGDWKSATGSVVRVYSCGAESCLKIVKLEPSAPTSVDTKNPDAALRGRPLCGLVIGTKFRATDADHLVDGYVYDPKSGHTYRGTMTSEGDTLKMHGYIGISLFGRTEVWSRAVAVETCR